MMMAGKPTSCGAKPFNGDLLKFKHANSSGSSPISECPFLARSQPTRSSWEESREEEGQEDRRRQMITQTQNGGHPVLCLDLYHKALTASSAPPAQLHHTHVLEKHSEEL
ncbi:unnamed protein product [Arctogadus glacialis]